MHIINESRGEFLISTDVSKLDKKAIHNYLSNESYWSKNIPYEKVEAAILNSLNFGVYAGERQIGYARIVTDYTIVAYLGDVFIIEEYRGKGLAKWLMEVIMNHKDLQGLRRWILLTRDAHELYKKYGWKEIASADRWMEIHKPNVYG
jgi:GNAT superfamily N-acetyltransferase